MSLFTPLTPHSNDRRGHELSLRHRVRVDTTQSLLRSYRSTTEDVGPRLHVTGDTRGRTRSGSTRTSEINKIDKEVVRCKLLLWRKKGLTYTRLCLEKQITYITRTVRKVLVRQGEGSEWCTTLVEGPSHKRTDGGGEVPRISVVLENRTTCQRLGRRTSNGSFLGVQCMEDRRHDRFTESWR